MRVPVIAELSSSHGGDLDLACRLIEQCAEVGADTIKFQSYQVRHLARTDPQYAWFEQAELSDDAHERLMRCCQRHQVRFLTTVFHQDRVPFLAGLGLTQIKIGSGEAMWRRLIDAVAEHPWEVLMSTGLATVQELSHAVRVLGSRAILLHCVSEYPTPVQHVNLCRIPWLRERFGVRVGYSDHTSGVSAPSAAMAVGAEVVEIHVADPSGPRFKEWDRSLEELIKLVDFRDDLARMMTLRPMGNPEGERPFVGRWTR